MFLEGLDHEIVYKNTQDAISMFKREKSRGLIGY